MSIADAVGQAQTAGIGNYAVRLAVGSMVSKRTGGRALCIFALSALGFASEAGAATLYDLRDPAFASLYGEYAPRGKCDGPLSLTIDETGLLFHVDGESRHTDAFEYAASFFGPDYSGISLAFFPFPVNDYEPGHVLMYVNADEVEGRISFEENLGPGERLAYSEARIVGSSPWLKCAATES